MEFFDRPPLAEHAYGRSEYVQGRDPDYNSLSLRDVLAKFWARKRLIFSLIIIGAVLSYVTAKTITPIYTGEAAIMIKPQQAGEPATNATIEAAIRGGPEAVPSEAIVLESRTLASKTIETLHLDRDSEFNPSLRKPKRLPALFDPALGLLDKVQSLRQNLAEFLSAAPETDDEPDQSTSADTSSTVVVDAFIRNLHVEVVPRSNVIRVSFKSSRPRTAAAVPNTLVQLYLAQLADEKDKALVQERERLDTLVLPTLGAKMNASETALAEYRQKSGLVTEQTPGVLGQELSDINAQLSAARVRKAETTARLSQIQGLVSSPGRPATSATTSPAAASESLILQHLRDQEVQLEAQLSAVAGSLGPSHPRTRQLTAELDEVRGAMRRESAGLVGRLKAEVAAAQAAEAALSRREAEFTRQFALVNGGDSHLQDLIRDSDADKQTYQRYLARSNDIYASMGHAQPDAILVSSAAVPLKPSFPNTRLMVMFGAAIGGGMGITLAAMLDLLLGGLRNKEQVEDILGIRCLGLVPRVKGWRRNQYSIPPLGRQNTAFRQAIRNVQLKLLSFDGRNDLQVVLVTAALPDEGKTSVAVGLAASLVADGYRVALVDCDLHRPSVHRMFEGPCGPGLINYFVGEASLAEIVHHDRSSGLDYVPVGTALSQEACHVTQITSDRLRAVVDRLTANYGFVILDSAPVLAVSDTLLLSQIAQKTIFVIRWARTPPSIARHAIMQLLEAGGAETGVLLSMVDGRRAAKHGDLIAGLHQRLESYYRS